VSSSRYFAEIRKLKPRAEMMPAYAGQQAGHINFGSNETPNPGRAPIVLLKVALVIANAPVPGLRG